jgi:hypothetical protein
MEPNLHWSYPLADPGQMALALNTQNVNFCHFDTYFAVYLLWNGGIQPGVREDILGGT